MIEDTAFLALPAADFEKSCDFYERTLGLKRVASNTEDIISADFGTPSLTIRIYEWEKEFVRGGHSGLFLHVADIRFAHRRLRDLDVPVTEIRREPWGGTVCTFSDPDGNRIDLLQMGGENSG